MLPSTYAFEYAGFLWPGHSGPNCCCYDSVLGGDQGLQL